jgi:hypothetical protein
MNLVVLLLPLERLGLVVLWCLSYDRNGTLEGMITRTPEDKSRQLCDCCKQFHFVSTKIALAKVAIADLALGVIHICQASSRGYGVGVPSRSAALVAVSVAS